MVFSILSENSEDKKLAWLKVSPIPPLDNPTAPLETVSLEGDLVYNTQTFSMKKIFTILAGHRKAAVLGFLAIAFVFFFSIRLFDKTQNQPFFQKVQVERGTLVVSVSESGQAVVANRVAVTTQASGTVDRVYVKNQDAVSAGDKIASVILDQVGQQKQAQSWTAYLSAQVSLNSASANLYSLQSTMFSKWKTYLDIAQNSTYQNSDSSPNTTNRILTPFTIVQDDWLAAEAAYKNQQNVIDQAQAALNSAWLSYQTSSSVIGAPISGTIIDLTIAPGMQIGGQSSATGNPLSFGIANIKSHGNPVVSVSLSEIDAMSVHPQDKAAITFDALPNKTFTGKVLGINMTGVVTSGVTTYPATIILDNKDDGIFPNMSATANIILEVKKNVLLVPVAAVQTQNGQSFVRILKNGVPQEVLVETGISSNAQTEIISGLSENEEVIIGTITQRQSNAQQDSSPFGAGVLRPGGLGGGSGGRR